VMQTTTLPVGPRSPTGSSRTPGTHGQPTAQRWPTQAEPTLTEPTQAQQTQAQQTQAEQNQAEPTLTEPTQAEPTLTEPTLTQQPSLKPTPVVLPGCATTSITRTPTSPSSSAN
jgi:hypothetical protein